MFKLCKYVGVYMYICVGMNGVFIYKVFNLKKNFKIKFVLFLKNEFYLRKLFFLMLIVVIWEILFVFLVFLNVEVCLENYVIFDFWLFN